MQTFSLQFFSASSPNVSTWFNKINKILDYYNHYIAILLADIFTLLISHSFL